MNVLNILNYKKHFITVIVSILNYLLIYSQQNTSQQNNVTITTGIIVEKEPDKPMQGAKAVLYEKGKEIESVITKTDGIVTFKLNPNTEYLMEISKEGYVSKRVSIVTRIPQYEKQQFEVAFSILLFVPCEGLDYSVLQNPVLKIIYNDVKRDFLADKTYDELMRAKLEQLMQKNEQCIEDKYQSVVKKADKLFNEKKYNESLNIYQDAKKLRPDDKYVNTQIDKINKILSEQKNNETAYQNYIAQADKQFRTQNYPLAKELYSRALEIKPQETYPAQQIAEIDKIISQKNKDEQEKLKRETDFQHYITEGDDAFKKDVCNKSVQAYRKALEIKPNDPDATQKLKEAEKACKEQQAQALEKKQKDTKYQQNILKGDSLFNKQKYEDALTFYKTALSIYPQEIYPQDQISEIENILRKQAKNTESQYKTLIKQGDKAFDNENFKLAKDNYEQALKLKPNETYPKEKIKIIDDILAEMQRIQAEEKAKQEQYNNTIAQADNAFKNADYTKALTLYQKATVLLPKEKYPQQKIDEIAKINQALADKMEKDYNSYIQQGDKDYLAKNYNQAINDYKNALQIKPNETYPAQRIDEINKILNEIAKKEAENKAKQDAYKAAIAKADNNFSNKQYDQALTFYKEALTYLPDEIYPKNKIEEISQIKKQKEIDDLYNKAISSADASMKQKKYEEAKTNYLQALNIKPNDIYAKQKIEEIDKIIEDEMKKLADAKARQDAFDKSVKEGDSYFANKDYNAAKVSYETANSIIPNKPYVKQKLTEIDNILKQIALDKQYNDIIVNADELFGTRDYETAKNKYKEALKIKPTEKYPQQKINEIDNILSQFAAEKKKRQELEKKYNQVIAKADQLFDNAKYDEALKEYENALTILPDEIYPKQKIGKIREIKSLLAKGEPKTTPAQKATPVNQDTKLPDLKFNNNEEKEKYLKELLVKYPPGITCEIYKEKYRTITRYIIIRENEANDFREIRYNWGVEYYRNDKPITGLYFKSQVSQREGEYFVRIEM